MKLIPSFLIGLSITLLFSCGSNNNDKNENSSTSIVDEKVPLRDNASAETQSVASAKEIGVAFLAENAKKPGIKTTASGLQYQVVKEGKGGNPSATSRVKVHYHGTTVDGKVFDSSVDRGEPVEFGLDQVIVGWTEGLQLMKKGAKYRFFIPEELAYGANPPSPAIEPYSCLIFDVELLSFE
jgi:FKBP-type peptidyl-prolyl cis-trans isomerase FklB